METVFVLAVSRHFRALLYITVFVSESSVLSMQASLNANHGRWVLRCSYKLFGLTVSHWWPSNPVLTQSRWLLPYRPVHHLSTLTAVIQSSFNEKGSFNLCAKPYCSVNLGALTILPGLILELGIKVGDAPSPSAQTLREVHVVVCISFMIMCSGTMK